MERVLHGTAGMRPIGVAGVARVEVARSDALLEQLYRRALEVEGRNSFDLREWVERAEAWRIVQALRECRGNRSAAARRLGIGRRTLYTKMDRLGVRPTWGVAEEGASALRPGVHRPE